MMQVITKDFQDESTDMTYPVLLQHIPDHLEPELDNDIILAIRSNGDFIDALVITNANELDGFSKFQFVERYFIKDHYRPYHGEIVLRN